MSELVSELFLMSWPVSELFLMSELVSELLRTSFDVIETAAYDVPPRDTVSAASATVMEGLGMDRRRMGFSLRNGRESAGRPRVRKGPTARTPRFAAAHGSVQCGMGGGRQLLLAALKLARQACRYTLVGNFVVTPQPRRRTCVYLVMSATSSLITVPTVQTVLASMRALGGERRGVTVRELACRTGICECDVHRSLERARAEDQVARVGNSPLGVPIFGLTSRALQFAETG